MADINNQDEELGSEKPGPRDEAIRQGIELLFFAYRDFTAEPDAILDQYGFGRAHHRVVHFVGRRPHMTVGELLEILRITKQSLNRVLGQLVRQGFIIQRPGESAAFVTRRKDDSGWNILRADAPATMFLKNPEGAGWILQPPGELPTLIVPLPQ